MPHSEHSDQLSLFPAQSPIGGQSNDRRDDIVNVASVPQRSPFRYPGGKTWLIPKLRSWMASLSPKPELLIEPFAGGGIVSLTAAFEGLANRIIMVELDPEVASVWQTILHGDVDWLCKKILSFEISVQSAQEEIQAPTKSVEALAFRTLLKNRVNHGGILAPGSGMIKNGEKGKGVASRWYPETLAKRIQAIRMVRDRIEFIQGDGLEVIEAHSARTDVAYFIDPPYSAAGKKAGTRLYTHFDIDHRGLFSLAAEARGDLLMTYDDADGVRKLADEYGLRYELVAMKNTHHAEMKELLIGKDFGWLHRRVA